jgi:CRISPR-associated endonuclease/helicase Cas3
MTSFTAFFQSLWRSDSWPEPEPFPWQTMLAERAANGDWPECISLPTGSGKTACLDVAVFALASTVKSPIRMPRRIWFVVDRRIVVDEAYERAKQLAEKLSKAKTGPLYEVAAALHDLAGTTGQPLAVARLRGGSWRDDGWAHLPSQPAIICSTVDQVGSALLFRAYGHSDNTAGIYAGLAANDSLIVLDEAQCAVPFLQTLQAIQRFRGPAWAGQPLHTPFRFSIMSATPPDGGKTIFPQPSERAAALDHPRLKQRCGAHKPAELLVVPGDSFIDKAVSNARKFCRDEGKRRIAVMVNRVATAEGIAVGLRKNLADSATVILLTGRMRPLDRDALVKQWYCLLKAGSEEIPDKPLIVVTTQCLEVGADFSFDALVTECASLDALRQRFGRLDRMGTLSTSPAVVLIREKDAKKPKDEDEADPIYGNAIFETWTWLSELAQQNAEKHVDFGIDAMGAFLRSTDKERLRSLSAPAPDAPVLLPAHLDLLSQTSQRPVPEPDISLFLHGKEPVAPEVRVVIRADLPDIANPRDAEEKWTDLLSLVPPTSPEMLSVPIYRLREWLNDRDAEDMSGDVEGMRQPPDEEESASLGSPFLIWRGSKHSIFTDNFRRIRPNDVVVLRLNDKGLRGLGQVPESPTGLGPRRLDLAEQSLVTARGRVVLRLNRAVLAPFADNTAVKDLLQLAEAEPDREEIQAALEAVLTREENAADETHLEALPDWLRRNVELLAKDKFRMEEHPGKGLILVGKKRHRPEESEVEDDPQADEEDLRSGGTGEVSLWDHTADVCSRAAEFARLCLPDEFSDAFLTVAHCHDLGKLDRRFQIMLRNGDEGEVDDERPLAKSQRLPERRSRHQNVEEDAHLPKDFRHEFLSMQLAERLGLAGNDEKTKDLILHLIAGHHGYARPFAPVATDENPPDISLKPFGIDTVFTAADRRDLPPAHRLNSGVADRFWRLTRRFGWWGLAYLEAVFRLSDWKASADPSKNAGEFDLVPSKSSVAGKHRESICLSAVDGSNPLGFLAALGTLRILSGALPDHDLQMSWQQHSGAWRPVLSFTESLDETTILEALSTNGLKLERMFTPELLEKSKNDGPRNKKGEPGWEDKLKFPVGHFREFCKAASAEPSPFAPFAAAWASELASKGEDEIQLARRTRFDFTAGNQAFIGMVRELHATCTKEDLRCSLFTGWRYSSTAVSMRWDILDEKRQYALQAIDPTNNSKNPPLADAGANFLAVEALPLFPMAPERRSSQPGFDRDEDGRSWSWPIWTSPLELDAIRSLLTLPFGSRDEWPAAERRALGVPVVFRSAIVQPSGRYRCFTPAQSL